MKPTLIVFTIAHLLLVPFTMAKPQPASAEARVPWRVHQRGQRYNMQPWAREPTGDRPTTQHSLEGQR